ncbi:DEAD/DEAH box helicase [Paramuribaculum intestinale]|uniref:DEAD/DEAH box helicase n=1 Tax=Paramuribaculum intestinale TaxID=2094151 RepID=UPI0025A9AB9A|nr:DEAD/DEAH box helicase [Paramuribaculum intestinale]
MTFEELDLSDEVLDALYDMNFSECTPIQEQAIPIALEGRDLLAVAQTGTGKTAAYLLPVISRLSEGDYPSDAVNCIVMAPTRELAQQIDRQMEGFSYFLPISSVAIYGGTDGKEFARQERGLKMGADMVIATPGRLLAHLSMGYVDLSKVSFFILDEADRMLDMGFYDDIMQIVRQLPKERQTLMFSATMPPKIQQLAATILNDPVEVKIAVSRPTDKISQSAFVCYEAQKTEILKHLLRERHSQRVIVFAASKLKVKELARALSKARIRIGEMHSDLDQTVRENVMLDFRAGNIDVLVATDIVARGIDIDDIAMVVNYDVPYEPEDYIHRIGRTARANSDGTAVTFVGERDQVKFGGIERFLGYEVKKEDLPERMGEAPQYRPERRSGSRQQPKSQKGRNGGGNSRRNGAPKGGRKSAGDARDAKDAAMTAVDRPSQGGGAEAGGANRGARRNNGRRKWHGRCKGGDNKGVGGESGHGGESGQ